MTKIEKQVRYTKRKLIDVTNKQEMCELAAEEIKNKSKEAVEVFYQNSLKLE